MEGGSLIKLVAEGAHTECTAANYRKLKGLMNLLHTDWCPSSAREAIKLLEARLDALHLDLEQRPPEEPAAIQAHIAYDKDICSLQIKLLQARLEDPNGQGVEALREALRRRMDRWQAHAR